MQRPLKTRGAVAGESGMDAIDVTAALHLRPARPADYRAENEAFGRLADTLAREPERMAQMLADTAMQLTAAHSAGVSLEEEVAGRRHFRWIATAGGFEKYLNTTMPRDASPCGSVLDRNQPILMADPARRYERILELDRPVQEVLLVPFYDGSTPVGTVWVVSHSEAKRFDPEDFRLLTGITRFAAAAVQTVGLVSRLRVVNATNERLTEVDQRMDDFLATLSHELRSPLGVLSSAVHLLKRQGGNGSAPPSNVVEIMERQTAQLAALVDDMTDMASIRSGKVELRIESLVMQDIVTRAVEHCEAQLEARQHRLVLSLPEEPVGLQGDGVRLTQVLTNLLNNAAKYTNAGGTIGVAVVSADDAVEVRVTDTGIGMSAHQLPRVFDMFMQAAPAERTLYSGLGIGLALVRRFVELHGGSVTARSDGPGRGSEFVVRLPRRRAAPVAARPGGA